jgi:hypothetical protein
MGKRGHTEEEILHACRVPEQVAAPGAGVCPACSSAPAGQASAACRPDSTMRIVEDLC